MASTSSNLDNFDGNLIKLIGDGTLSSFESAVKAVECAVKIIKHIDKNIFCSPIRRSLVFLVHITDFLSF